MKKAKKLFKSPTKSSGGVNGHSSFSPAAASALSLSPVAEQATDNDADNGNDFNKAFRGITSSDVDRRVNDSLHKSQSVRRSGGEYDVGNVRRHPHEVDREVDSDALKSYDDGRRRRAQQQREQSQRKQQQGRTKKHSSSGDVNGEQDGETHSRHRRGKSTPAPPFAPDDYSEYSSKQKRTIDNYVQSVIANAGSDEYVTPLPRMDSQNRSGFFSETSSEGDGGTKPPHDDKNLLPIPGFGEVDLLQRAIQRRELLHDRITKMEAASAEFAREENQRELSRQQRKKNVDRKARRATTEENNDRMNQISERIKAEALEFLNFDHVPDEASDNMTDDVSNSTKDPSDNEGIDPPEEYTDVSSQQRRHRNKKGDSLIDQGPTSHQLARYANMVKLGIPELAILRSMERDGIDTPQGKVILERLKNETGIKTAPSDELLDKKKNTAPQKESSVFDSPVSLRSLITEIRESPKPKIRKDSLPPLKDDPNYNKYFKMIKAKVPLSWVKRVLEVDGKDARVLDLDPDRPLIEQIAGAGVDEHGNVDWSKVSIFRVGSDRSVESSGDELMGKSSKHKTTPRKKQSSDIYNETAANVKAELAIMTAKAGRLSRDSSGSRQSSFSGSSNDAKEQRPSHSDISSEAAAASNARLNRLKAMKTPDRSTLRRKQSVDEIRRRPPPPPPKTPKPSNQIASPPASGNSTASIERAVVSSRRQTYKDVPLKDDPRFSKYFQMIRSRVPRSWVERVIEVDDRDPAILDLDPNKPLAAQVDDDDTKSLIRTLATETDGSLDESIRSGALESVGASPSSGVYQLKNDRALSPTHEVLKESVPPITQIVNAVDEERSVASSITNFKDAEQSNAVLDRISAFLDKIESKAESNVAQQTSEVTDNNRPSRLLPNPDDIESKLNALIERFDSTAPRKPAQEEVQTDSQADRDQFLDENKADIAKLSALLASKLADQSDANGKSANDEQSDLAKLSSLLNNVLTKMDEPLPSDQGNNNSAKNVPLPGKLGKNAALEAMFAKRAALAEERGPPILRDDPEYQKYFKMLKVGMPRPTVEQALERDGKSVSILDLDPERPLADQQKEEKQKPNNALEALFANRAAALQPPKQTDVPLKLDPEFQKYFKMLKVGMPRDSVVQALERDGKSASILDLDPEKSYASQTATADETGGEEIKSDVPIKDDPEYSKFFKMLRMGIPLGAVEQALQKEGKDKSIASMDPNISYASQIKEKEEEANSKTDAVPLKDDPEYSKFFKMLKMGIPLPAVKQALMKEGKDPNIIDMDPDKPLAKAVPLKDDEEYSKFFKMLKMGIPLPAVKQALVKEGKDPNIIDMDPDKPLSQQHQSKQIAKKPVKANDGPKVARKRLHWNKIDESKLNEKSFWNQAKDEHASLQLVGLDIDNEEFASLFTSQVNKTAAPKKDPASDVKKSSSKQKVQLIDGRRRMNGSILLTKFKVNYKQLAKQVDNMEYVKAEGNELRGMMQLLPTKDESLALRSYLPPLDAPQSEIDEAIDKLGECEQYMAVMLDVPDAKEKFQCMLFRAEFEQQVDSIRDGTKLLIDACDSVQNSERFKKLLMYALKLGNALNTDGSSAEATAITLDSLLKLAEAKAFDRQTSVLHYLVSIVSKNDEDVLLISEDFIPVKAAERVAVDMLSQQLNELTKGIELIKEMSKKYARQSESTVDKETEDETPEDELLSATPMGKFSLSAESKITSLTKEFAEAKVNFADLLEFFGEDSNLTPEAFFCTINTFVSMFDQTHKELKRKEEAKERKMRIDEKRRLREEAAKQGKAKS